jgi:hypothetical protein
VTYQRIPERVVPGKRLGRHVGQDPRSLRYLVKPRAHAAKSVQWTRVTPVLDQGDLGSCTGNATVGVLGSTPYAATIPAGVTLDEALAVSIYSAATHLDDFDGAYEPDDTGSDGTSAAKAAQRLGLISGYLHCTSVDAVVTALQDGPVITGVNWYEGMDEPDSSGRVKVSGQVRGGHEFELLGVDLEARTVHAVNSWGESWGQGGHFRFSLTDLERLLKEDGDVTAFVPITAPAPTPAPVPVAGSSVTFTADQYAAMTKWASNKSYTGTAAARRAWKTATA